MLWVPGTTPGNREVMLTNLLEKRRQWLSAGLPESDLPMYMVRAALAVRVGVGVGKEESLA
jgi:predicted transglutaminase-like cysteine proteinase